jgi:phosphatidylserine/phosphatidylglycerophosphate/cardiolipin synthase-like enzyme
VRDAARSPITVIVQPRDGINPLLDAIRSAERTLDLTIYRADRLEIEQSLVEAADRGVRVHVLTTTTNRHDAKNLRKLESRLNATKVQVSQTARDLVRYHNKMMIVDQEALYLLTFNFSFVDIHHSRSFGVVIRDPETVAEAVGLFEADVQQAPVPKAEHLIVSPINARQKLEEYIIGARRQLLIYDGRLTDDQMIRLLTQRAREGIDVRVIGKLVKRVREIAVRPMPQVNLHAQAIIRDEESVFLGSQSLRKAELDNRREVGLIIDDCEVVNHLLLVFEMDWGDIVNP